MPEVDLEQLPFLTHYPQDGGPYASAAVVFINDPLTGRNASFHRLLRLDKARMAARLVERRGVETAWRNSEDGIPIGICIGLPLHVLLAASMAPPPGVDEMSIAQPSHRPDDRARQRRARPGRCGVRAGGMDHQDADR